MLFFLQIDLSLLASIALFMTFALVISGVVWALSYVLAIHSPDTEKTSAYECGFEPFEDARNRFDVRFYIVAILFLLFDVEVAFLVPWAVTIGVTGAVGYGLTVAFLVLLTVGFIYEVAKGALNLR